MATEPDRDAGSSRSGWSCCSPTSPSWSYTDYTLQTFGKHRVARKIERNGRVFYYGRADVQAAATKMLAEVPKIAKPGEKLFVGTEDLRKTPYSDAWLYYLLPEYPPGTYYIEMDPGVANSKDGRLASDLAHSDIAILSSRVERLLRAERLTQGRLQRGEQGPRPRLLPRAQLRRPLPALPPVH